MEFLNKKNPMDDFIFESREDALAFNDVTKNDISAFTEKYLNYVVHDNYDHLKNNEELISKHLRPTQLRDEEEGDENKGWYDLLVDYLNTKEKENNEEKTSVNNAMIHLKVANKMLDEITSFIKDTRKSLDKKKVGTSQCSINNILVFSYATLKTTYIDNFTKEYLNYVNNNKKKLLQCQIINEESCDYFNTKNNEEKESVNLAMKHLEDAQKYLNMITTIIKDTRKNIYKNLVGTLEGRIRSQIYMNNSNPLLPKIEAHDVLAQAVLDQPYDEHAVLKKDSYKKGGKNKRVMKTKKRKTKKRKTNKKIITPFLI